MIYESDRNMQLQSTRQTPSWVRELPCQSKAIEAIRQDDALLLREALSEGAEVNHSERPLLVEAALARRFTFVGWLLELGAEVNARNLRGESALYAAAQSGDLRIAELLFFHDAKVDLADSWGVTPLMTAVFHGHCPMVIFLKNWGASPSAKNNDGLNALSHVRLGRAALERKGRRSIREARDFFSRGRISREELNDCIAQDFELLREAEQEYDLIRDHLTSIEAKEGNLPFSNIKPSKSPAATTAA
jgi:Ankyrin repeats (3 copies)